MPHIYFGLGSNLGDKEQNLDLAINKIKKQIGKVISLSAFHLSEPWGFESQNNFLNAVVCIETTLTPKELLEKTKQIEKELGRKTKSVEGTYSDRLIDIDILLYDKLILNTPELTIPHPLMQQREFVMKPLCEIAPQLIHPQLGKTMKELCDKL